MRGVARAPAVGLHLVCFYMYIKLASSTDYGVPIEIKLWDTGRTPLAHMVDVTNGFGLKVLAEHNFLNENNIAFSPYGLLGILVALYEGVDGEASYQIQRGMQLPWNRNIMRVGFRDIHRTLKTYFVPEEGFLAGLALNNENVTFNESYKKVLRFYGFDLENDKLPTLPPTNGTNETATAPSTMGTEASAGDSTSPTVAMTTQGMPASEGTETTQAREETTANPNAETFNDVDIRGPTTTPGSPSSAPNSETAADTAPSMVDALPEQVTTTQSPTSVSPETTVQTTVQTTAATTTMPSTPEQTTVAATTTLATETETIASQTVQTTASLTVEPTDNNEVDALTTRMDDTSSTLAGTTSIETTTATNTLPPATETTMSSDQTQQTDEITMSTTDMTTLSDLMSTTTNESSLETLQRRKKSIVDFIFTSPPYVDDYLFYRSYDVPANPEIAKPNFEGNKMFLANGLRNVQVTYMNYDTVLEHAYLPHLEASALRLPLDSERYYLLVVLPAREGAPELGRLLARMARESDLSDVYNALRPRRVRAIVPSFTVKGHVTLTTDLQKLGIRDVFEPRQRDFTPMTHQAGVYVRSIEQAVSVAMRKYRPDDHKTNRYVTNRHPVSFSATYPFLYFVMDASIHVALMAGKMVDPLNTRIL